MSSLPPTWASPTLLNCAQFVRGVTYTKSDASNLPKIGLIPVIRANNIQSGKLDLNDLVYVPESLVSSEQSLNIGDVVIATSSGSISVVGKAAQVLQAQHISFGAFCGVLRPSPPIYTRYFGHFFSSKAYRDSVSEMARGVNINNLKRDHFQAINIPLAPFLEQKRIADKLDAVLSRVDAVNARLSRIAPLLKRFRQSVLAAATSGRLTEDWRNSNTMHISWSNVTLGDVIKEMRNGLAAKPDENLNGKKILRISAVRPGILDISDHRHLTIGISDASTYSLRQGDLLFTRYNGSLEYVGVCAMVSKDLPNYVYPDKLIRVRAKTEVALPKFLELATSSAEARRQIEGYVKSSAGQKGISGSSLKTLRISVPSIKEQTEIVRRVETLFAFADRLEARLQAARTAAERLTPSLLAKAFRGELVPQDPKDEPAAELLKRLAENRASPTRSGKKSAIVRHPATGDLHA